MALVRGQDKAEQDPYVLVDTGVLQRAGLLF